MGTLLSIGFTVVCTRQRAAPWPRAEVGGGARQRDGADRIRDRTDETDASMRADASSTASTNRERVDAVVRSYGRDARGRYTGRDHVAKDHEAEGLRRYARIFGETPNAQQVRVRVDGSDQSRYYDGLVRIESNRFEGIEVKSGSAGARYEGVNHVQRLFDEALSATNPARGVLDGEAIEVISVVVIRVD
ncbi:MULTISPECIES: hypothetical protein [unclassified Agrococcus]|uniref:hypothetical protein n=1 Tax=unclassified Agrococcus TaxID=2615065 RepID=UPI00361506EE